MSVDGDPFDRTVRDRLPARIGHYAIARKIGQGGMGVVYAARDERLQRDVALKTMVPAAVDEAARRRFWREARSAASVNHPNVCQVYEIGEDGGELFIAMELLDGESLADRLRRGSLSVSDALPICLGILSALSELHARGIVHRDLKPSNVFLTRHGVKVLDFGLARAGLDAATVMLTELTMSGIVMGTPRYMAPEQVRGEPVDARCDLFAAGAILFEMLAGRPAFDGRTPVDVLHATLHEQPPALMGPPAVAAVDRVIRRALSKRPSDRPSTADTMADLLRGIHDTSVEGAPVIARALTRVVVLPFRVLRSDPETDFLAFSLPDAIATSLSAIGSVVVRSTATAARFADVPDLKALASDADVDRVVMGTLLRAGEQLRVTAQLVEAPAGTLLTSQTVQSSLGDLFRLQDDITHRIVDALSLPLGADTTSSARDAPHDPRAYDLYLRANEMARTYDGLPRARDLYERCLALDPDFAPAWAHLGRSHRVIGKYIEEQPDSEVQAERAFTRALAINPGLSIAHKFYAHLEADMGHAEAALLRLVEQAHRHRNDPALFAGLVHACRYCGLFDLSIAAHAEARRLDPNVPTSVEQTLLMKGDIERLQGIDQPVVIAGADDGIRVIGLALSGRRDEARSALFEMRRIPRIPAFRTWTELLMAWIERRPAEVLGALETLRGLKVQEDPEAMFQEGWLLCDLGEYREGLRLVQHGVKKGYFVSETLAKRAEFDALRGDEAFRTITAEAEEHRRHALNAFRQSGGERLLGRVREGVSTR